jgi:hypothetical protein
MAFNDQNQNQNSNPTPADVAGVTPGASPATGGTPQATSAPQAGAQSQQQAQSAEAAPAARVTPPAPGAFFKNVSHAFLGAVLGSLAGRPENAYSVDPENGEMTSTPVTRTGSDAVRSLARNALTGLAAASQEPTRKSGAASALSGFGAGFGAVSQQQKQEDIQKRQQADADYNRQQEQIVRKSNVAHLNANTLATYFGNLKLGNDMDPVFSVNRSLYDAVQSSPELGHAEILTDSEAAARNANDPHFGADHILLPLGRVPKLDADGKPVTDEQGNPISTMQIAAIPGHHDGKLVVPKSLAADVQQYGARAGIGNYQDFAAGSEFPLAKVVPVLAAVEAEKKAELGGWAKPSVVFVDGKQKLMNSYTNDSTDLRDLPEGVKLNVKDNTKEPGAVTDEDEYKRQTELQVAAMKEKNENARSAQKDSPEAKRRDKGVDKIDAFWTDPHSGFSATLAQANQTIRSIQAGANGAGLLTSLAPTMEVLGINHAAGISRISPQEAQAAGAPGGFAEQWNAWATKAAKGALTPQLAREGQRLMNIVTTAAHQKAVASSNQIALNTGVDPNTVWVMDVNGQPVSLDSQVKKYSPSAPNSPNTSTPPKGATHVVPGPDGKNHWTNDAGTVDYGVAN